LQEIELSWSNVTYKLQKTSLLGQKMTQHEHKPCQRNTVDLIPYANNSRTHSAEQVKQIAASIKEFGFTNPVIVDEENGIIAGHGRVMAAEKIGLDKVPCVQVSGWTDAQKKAYVIADNQLPLNAGWNMDLLKVEIEGLQELDFDTDILGFDDDFMKDMFDEDGEAYADGIKGQMSSDFGLPPFTVLNARDGGWQKRKNFWTAQGINSGAGRKDDLLEMGSLEKRSVSDTSIFDPVLCEIAYEWFSPKEGVVLDPFAGGSVRGIMAAYCGREYFGNDLRSEQVAENIAQAEAIKENLEITPQWTVGDSCDIKKLAGRDFKADMMLSCPPYADLEVYSDKPEDLSNMSYEEFLKLYRKIIAESYDLMKDNTFAVWVVGEIRNKQGNYHNFVGDTVTAFIDAGFNYYNEAILVTAIGTLPLRAGKSMRASRKLGKTHQNILIFVKGDGKKAAANCGDIKITEIEEVADA